MENVNQSFDSNLQKVNLIFHNASFHNRRHFKFKKDFVRKYLLSNQKYLLKSIF